MRPAATPTPTRILLVEDNQGDARLVEELLAEADAAFEVEVVTRLSDAVERLKSDDAPIDAVLLDLGLPDSQGLETLRGLYAEGRDTAIVVLTGLDDGSTGIEAVKAGAQDYLPKGRISADALSRVLGYAQERKHGEEALRRSEAIRDVAEQVAGVGSWSWDLATQKVDWSPGMFRLWDVDPGSFDGDVTPILKQRVHPDDLPSLLETTATALEKRETFPVEFRLILGDGSERIVASEGTVERDAAGNAVAITGYYQDVTERRLADEKVARQVAVTAAIDRVLQASLQAETIEEVARICLSEAEGLTGSKFGWIGEVNASGRLDTIAMSDPGWETCTIPGSVYHEDREIKGIFGRVLRDGESLLTNEPGTHPARVGLPIGHPELTAYLGVPLKQNGHTVGMVSLANKPSGYAPRDQKAVEALSVTFVEALRRRRAEIALRESEERYRDLVENLTDVIFTVDIEGVITYISQSVSQLAGYVPEELVGQPFSGFIHPDDMPRLDRVFRDIFVKSVEPWDFRYRTKDGETRWARTSSRVIREGERVVGIRGLFSDVTERRHAEEALRAAEARSASEARFRQMFDAHAVIMLLFDPRDGSLVEANRAACDFYKYSADELRAMNLSDISLTPPPVITEDWRQDLAGEGGVHFVTHVRAGGERREVEVHSAPVTLGDRVLLYAVIFDVTERRRAEEALRDRERQLAEAQRIARIGSWTWDAATDSTTYSEECCRIFGRLPAEVGSAPYVWLGFLHAEDRAKTREVTDRAQVDGRPYVIDYRVMWPDGSEHVARERGESVLDGEGSVLTMFGTVQDITDQLSAENELRRRAEELELFNRAMVDRELRIIEMKEAVNELSRRLGEELPYAEVWRETGGEEAAAE